MGVIYLGKHLMARNGILPSMSGDSMVNYMCRSTELRWLKKVSTWFFFTIVMIQSTILFHHGLGMGYSGPSTISSKYPI